MFTQESLTDKLNQIALYVTKGNLLKAVTRPRKNSFKADLHGTIFAYDCRMRFL